MSTRLWIILVCFSVIAFGESFPWELEQKKQEVKMAIGEKKMRAIEMATRSIEIYRITQLLTIEGIGQKTVDKLSKILGVRFEYKFNNEICYRGKMC